MRSYRVTPLFLTGIFLVMLMHAFVPHHHHLESLPSVHSCNANDEEGDLPAKDKPPFHCHAFNNLSFVSNQKTAGQVLSKLQSPVTEIATPACYHYFPGFGKQIAYLVTTGKIVKAKPYHLSSRAPPLG